MVVRPGHQNADEIDAKILLWSTYAILNDFGINPSYERQRKFGIVDELSDYSRLEPIMIGKAELSTSGVKINRYFFLRCCCVGKPLKTCSEGILAFVWGIIFR